MKQISTTLIIVGLVLAAGCTVEPTDKASDELVVRHTFETLTATTRPTEGGLETVLVDLETSEEVATFHWDDDTGEASLSLYAEAVTYPVEFDEPPTLATANDLVHSAYHVIAGDSSDRLPICGIFCCECWWNQEHQHIHCGWIPFCD